MNNKYKISFWTNRIQDEHLQKKSSEMVYKNAIRFIPLMMVYFSVYTLFNTINLF